MEDTVSKVESNLSYVADFTLRYLVGKKNNREGMQMLSFWVFFLLVPQMGYHWVAKAKPDSIVLTENQHKIHFCFLLKASEASL